MVEAVPDPVQHMSTRHLSLSTSAPTMIGPLRDRLDWSGLFTAMSAMIVVKLVLWQFMRLRKQHVALEVLEEGFAQKAPKAKGPLSGIVPELGVAGQVG